MQFCKRCLNLRGIERQHTSFTVTRILVAKAHFQTNKEVNISNFAQMDVSAALETPFRHKPKVVFVLGGPGSGKGTQCERMVKEYGVTHLSAGDLLREERNSGSSNGELIDRMIKEGQIVPLAVTLGLLKRSMLQSGQELFLIDGFPRNNDNLQGWEGILGDSVDVKHVLFYDCSEAEMEKRLLERGKTSGRTDDNIESIKKRFRTYLESTIPVIDYYEKQDKVVRITASPPPDIVFKSTAKVMDGVLKAHLVDLTQRLLDCIVEGDYETYEELVDNSLTAFEPEAVGHLVEGLDFHQFYFKNGKRGTLALKSTLTDTHVRLMGTSAVVSYVRLVQHSNDGKFHTSAYEETRVWQRKEGGWKHVHFHRSKPTAV